MTILDLGYPDGHEMRQGQTLILIGREENAHLRPRFVLVDGDALILSIRFGHYEQLAVDTGVPARALREPGGALELSILRAGTDASVLVSALSDTRVRAALCETWLERAEILTRWGLS